MRKKQHKDDSIMSFFLTTLFLPIAMFEGNMIITAILTAYVLIWLYANLSYNERRACTTRSGASSKHRKYVKDCNMDFSELQLLPEEKMEEIGK